MHDAIREIFNKNRIHEAFVKLATNGMANEIYATSNFILRIPTDHPEAESDAFTEAIAAPLAKLNGIKTPKLICFDDSHTIINKTYSIWERIHGITLGEADDYMDYCNTWKEIGSELGKLHANIKSCEDPKGWLDSPDRNYTKDGMLQCLMNKDSKSLYLQELIENKYTDKTFSYEKCFVHGDTNEFNFLCSPNDQLLSVIDWGDSGWGDPAIDFYMIPMEVLELVLEGYKEVPQTKVDINFIYRMILDKVWIGMEEEQAIEELENSIKELENTLLKGF